MGKYLLHQLQVAGMRKPCEGSRDKTRPESTKWVTAPYRMFFGRNRTKTWGPGGVAFMDLEKLKNPRAHIRLYKIRSNTYILNVCY